MRTDQHHEQGVFVARAAFPRKPEAVGPAREWARTVYCREGGTQPETCALVVSELVTNAVDHAEGDLVEVTVRTSPLSIDVRDGSPKEPEIQGPDDDDEHGRGLILVSALSSCFEVIPLDDGKICRFWLEEE